MVEGKYDKAKLSSLLDATIIETGGFRIYKDREKLQLLRLLGKKHGLVILTDSDAAGFQIRGYLKGAIPGVKLYNAYIPDILGKEKRKAKPSAEGKLGVEGVPSKVILQALERAGVLAQEQPAPRRHITKADFVELGLSGGPDSSARRHALLQRAGLPAQLSANAMVDILDSMMSYEEFLQLAQES